MNDWNHIQSMTHSIGASYAKQSVYDCLLARIRLRARRRIAWLRKLWIEVEGTSQGEGTLNVHSEVDGYLRNGDSCAAEWEWQVSNAELPALNEELRETEAALEANTHSRIAQLQSIFDLQSHEIDIVQACLAQCIDPNLGRVFAYLHDHNGRGYVSSQLVARLFNHGTFIALGASSPLLVWNIIREIDMGKGEPGRLELDPFIRNWLLENDDVDAVLFSNIIIPGKNDPLPHWPVESTVRTIRELLTGNPLNKLRVYVAGEEGSGRKNFVAAICAAFKVAAFFVEVKENGDHDWQQFFMRAQRQAVLDNCVPVFQGSGALVQSWPDYYLTSNLQFVIGAPDEGPVPVAHYTDLRVELPSIPMEESLQLWRKFIPSSADWPVEELRLLSRRHQVSISQFAMLSKRNITTIDDASAVLRGLSRQRLGELATLANSSFTWDDLVIPGNLRSALDDFYFEAIERRVVWDKASIKRLFPQGRGLMALFTGTPGTGKTMAAQVIANSLQLDLFRIDLSMMISKYIGETSKNINRILSRAKRMDVVLLFDEADALFGKRTDQRDAHDRYANTDTNYLLQAIEEYPGIAILASNRKANIDSGFMRRLRYVLDFPKPDASQRARIWSNLVNELAEVQLTDIELSRLGSLVDITGAQIKLAILSALYMARKDGEKVNLTYLLRGVERELAKEGRSIGKQMHELVKYYSSNGQQR